MDFLDGAFAQHLVHYGYGAIFLIVMMESAGIPMPGETVLVSAAVYAGTRHALDIRFIRSRRRCNRWRQYRFLGRSGIRRAVAREMGSSHRARCQEENAGPVPV
jgi:hypothetical protein